MTNLYYLTVIFLTISVISGQYSSSEPNDDIGLKDIISQVVGRVERNREECPNLPERSAAEDQLKKCILELKEAFKQVKRMDSDEDQTYKAGCDVLASFLECSSNLIDEMVSCGKNPEMVTIIGFAKGSCEYEKKKSFIVLRAEMLKPCKREFGKAFEQCAREDLENLEVVHSIDSFLNVFCPAGKIARKCAASALEAHCPEAFIELSKWYQSSRSLSGNPAAFDSCLASSSS